MTSKTAGKAVFILIFASLFICGSSYLSGRIFMQLHHLPLDNAGIFTIWQYWLAYYQHPNTFVKITVNLCAFGPYLLAAAAGFAALMHRKPQSLHGDARFARLNEIKKARIIVPPTSKQKLFAEFVKQVDKSKYDGMFI